MEIKMLELLKKIKFDCDNYRSAFPNRILPGTYSDICAFLREYNLEKGKSKLLETGVEHWGKSS